MAMMLANWIGPILEAEIKAAMESKMAHVYSGSSITVTSSPYYAEYQLDRSSLRASLRFSDDQTEQVQVLEVLLS